jgi:hypothetical protein
VAFGVVGGIAFAILLVTSRRMRVTSAEAAATVP